jgi:predicted XRE-type DNA-binding protein
MKNGAKKTLKKKDDDELIVERSSGNVFADLGYPNPEEALAKSRLARVIADILKQRGLSQTQAARLLGIDQPKISRLVRGQFREFSLERLIQFLGALDRRVDIVVRPAKGKRKKEYLNVEAA